MGVNPRESPPPHRGYKMGLPCAEPRSTCGLGRWAWLWVGVVVALACVCLFVCLFLFVGVCLNNPPVMCASPGGLVVGMLVLMMALGRVGRPCGRPRQVATEESSLQEGARSLNNPRLGLSASRSAPSGGVFPVGLVMGMLELIDNPR